MAFLASQQGAAKRRRTNNGTQDASIIADPQYDETVGSSSRTTMAASQPRSLNGTRGNSAATSIAQGNTSAASLMGSTSTASGLRRSARNMRSVNEVIGGKVSTTNRLVSGKHFALDGGGEDPPKPCGPECDSRFGPIVLFWCSAYPPRIDHQGSLWLQ